MASFGTWTSCRGLLRLLILGAIAHLTRALYEDQIGTFDWRQHYIGRAKHGSFDSSSLDRIIIATESNVLAAISAKTGDILWRQVLEKSPRGDIKMLHVPSLTNGIQFGGSRSNRAFDIITVTGVSPALIRGWNPNTGTLEWEWSLVPTSLEKAEHSFWFLEDSLLYNVVPVWGSHLEVTEYQASSGQQPKQTTSRISAAWIKPERCIMSSSFFVCTIDRQLLALDLTAENPQVTMRDLDIPASNSPMPVVGDASIIQDSKLYSLTSDRKLDLASDDSVLVDDTIIEGEQVLLRASLQRESNILKLSANRLKDNSSFEPIEFNSDYPDTLGSPKVLSVRCKTSNSGRTQGQLACRLLISSTDGAISLIQQGKIKWTREEALAEIETADFLDLTLSDAEGAIEEELNNKNDDSSLEWDVVGAFQRRITNQIAHLKNLILHVLGLGPAPSKAQRAGLVRDDFGLHKMLVAVTSSGKVFGIDNVSGKHHWIRYIPQLVGFNNGQGMKLLVQRTSRFYPLSAQCIILGRHRDTKNGLMYQFNPITGQPINGGLIELPYKVRQISLLHETGPDFIRGLLVLDQQSEAHVYPESAAKFANNFYLFSADREKAIIDGFVVEYSNGRLSTTPTWSVNLSGAERGQQIVAIESKNPIEHVHSQGRVLSDRSVLYKYINPNLIAVATHGPDNIHKYILNVHLVDVVSGSIVFSMSHKRIRPPLHMIHSENWLVYSYYNDKVRRTEITSVELYEGKTQTNGTAWSSLDAPPLPLVERQSYIMPVAVASMKETITEKGITNKHVLIGLTTGTVAEMSWAFLDPRRPVTSPEKAREEGIIPYMPELPMPHEILFNYNQTVANIKGIHTAPSGLESTCLVLVHGLDIFVTRVAPSKTFDLLKEDFDYFLITVVLTLLTSTSYIVKHFASKKAIKQAWK
ncbi:ER membrane protein complex subunit 1 isoform X2 [Uranotaenia lowii]|uniref:ER membrane protein complex subunit 1 isoform X2 n=1 Tax=Uranotaenia lowii TaxID=190385 RepID=UPI002479983D|nr:ER membrane protein complex subunit 1 isoform X2 [Uranotaenia lowii]